MDSVLSVTMRDKLQNMKRPQMLAASPLALGDVGDCAWGNLEYLPQGTHIKAGTKLVLSVSDAVEVAISILVCGQRCHYPVQEGCRGVQNQLDGYQDGGLL
eukprot:gene31963-33888_t